MPHVITISDENFAWLQRLSVPLIDKDVDDVLSKRVRPLLDTVVDKEQEAPSLLTPRVVRSTRGIPQHRFGRVLLEVLRDIGPDYRVVVLKEMERRLGDSLTPIDKEQEQSGAIVWCHRVDATKALYKRYGLEEDVERGVWAITVQGLEALKAMQ